MSEERLKHRLALLVGERGDELPGAGFARGDALGGLDVALGGTRAHGAGGARERPYGRRRVARRVAPGARERGERGAERGADDDAADDDAADDDATDDDAADAARAAAARPVRGDPARRSAATKGPIPTRHRRVPAPERLLLAERRTSRAPPRATPAKPDACARRERLSRDARRPRREKTASRRARATHAPVRDAPPRRAPARQTSAIHVWRDSRLVIGASAERARDSRLLFVRVFVQHAVRTRRPARIGRLFDDVVRGSSPRFVHLTYTRASFLSRPSRARTRRTPSHFSRHPSRVRARP